ncbi:GNAT family N-acetyltransferase [Heyndrickxia sp. FSL W8-0496]|uniref:GNAT family N-acetyltransferase n=1 Tax=Heyndrickxia TaxID=2837504 RepID=UPI0030F4CDD9
MEIRHLNGTDAIRYRTLRLQALQMSPEAFGSSYEEEKDAPLEQYISKLESDVAFTFGAFDNQELIGTVTFVKETKRKLKHRGSIFALFVKPDKRKLGVANALLKEVLNKANELRVIEQIYLSVVASNIAAKNLYSKFGFRTFALEKHALKMENQYFDEEHMVLFLSQQQES